MCDLSVASKLKDIMHNDPLCLLLLRKPCITNQAVANKKRTKERHSQNTIQTVGVYSVTLSLNYTTLRNIM